MRAVARPSPEAERALRHAFVELGRARQERDAASARVNRFCELIVVLIDSLPQEQQAAYRARFEEIRSGFISPRGGKTFGQVFQLFKDRGAEPLTVTDVVKAISERAQEPADPKAVTNALNYLTSSGRLERVARGMYRVRDLGVGYVTAEEIPGADHGTTRATEHDWGC